VAGELPPLFRLLSIQQGQLVTSLPNVHLALARRYRPQTFVDVVGQDHVLKGLCYSLDQQRLHHAYLFTGSRGVGKTSLGRIFAKALNCEQGVSATPCGTCVACEGIASGRFIDLIEVDGASNTKVEDTRELLEDVQYVPTHGRFKVYLIDEVHMLSTHSFNALLKTLEEPPEHVKFILATTDPQKLPVTVLSRCIQFNLQLLPVNLIKDQLQQVLTQDQVKCSDHGLFLLAQAAKGSMRDALTLADQARSQGQGQIDSQSVSTMLGLLDQESSYKLLSNLINDSMAQTLASFEQIEASGIEIDQICQDLLEVCHQVALTQAMGQDFARKLYPDPSLCQQLIALAQQASAEQIQLCYQTLLETRRMLEYAGSPASALRMALLRIVCFQQINVSELSDVKVTEPKTQAGPEPAGTSIKSESEKKKPLTTRSTHRPQSDSAPNSKPLHSRSSQPGEDLAQPSRAQLDKPSQTPDQSNQQQLQAQFDPGQLPQLVNPKQWYDCVCQLDLGGLAGQLALHSRLLCVTQDDNQWHAKIQISPSVFGYEANKIDPLFSHGLSKIYNVSVQVSTQQQAELSHMPVEQRRAELAAQAQALTESIHAQPFIDHLRQHARAQVHIETGQDNRFCDRTEF